MYDDLTAADILSMLRAEGSVERASRSDWYFPTKMAVLGISNPEVKRLMREIYKSLRDRPREAILLLCRELVASHVMEGQMLAWLLLEKAKIVGTLEKEEMEGIPGILDNWASVDAYGVMIYGILWRLGKISDRDVAALQESEDVWQRRLALVATVALNLSSRGGTGDASRTLAVCKRAVNDHHDMIVKALSWSLRSLVRWDRKAVEQFLGEQRNSLHKRVLREVSHKLEHGTKN